VGKRRWRARTPRPGGTSDARREREASWSAERQFRFGRQTGALDQFGGFCLNTHPIVSRKQAIGFLEHASQRLLATA